MPNKIAIRASGEAEIPLVASVPESDGEQMFQAIAKKLLAVTRKFDFQQRS